MSISRYLSKLGALLGSDGKVPQTALAANVAGNGPAFSAYSTVGQSGVSNNVSTKVLFDTEAFDTNNNFASSRFTPTVAGYYQINGSTGVATTNGAYGLTTSIWKNGALFKQGSSGKAAAGMYAQSNVSALVYFNGSTDYVELYTYTDVGGTTTLLTYYASSFDGALVRAA